MLWWFQHSTTAIHTLIRPFSLLVLCKPGYMGPPRQGMVIPTVLVVLSNTSRQKENLRSNRSQNLYFFSSYDESCGVMVTLWAVAPEIRIQVPA